MKVFTGEVISKRMEKTATVVVRRLMQHPMYKKRIERVKKYQVHDEIGVKPGQKVRFVASKPYSKLKKWKIIEVVGENGKTKKKSKKSTKTEASSGRKKKGSKK